MRKLKWTLLLGIGILFSAASCNNTPQNTDKNKEMDRDTSYVTPNTGDETRYNLNPSDTMAAPKDTNRSGVPYPTNP